MLPCPAPALAAFLELPSEERTLGPYRLVEQLGRGGFAPVWLAREVHGDKEFRTVAVKLFHVERAGESRDLILEEARALCQVEHPNIVRFYSFQTNAGGDVLGLAMEYARGVSVDKRLDERGRLPVRDVLSLGVSLASALAEIHRVGLIHRDVKPANVIDAGGVYKLIDFGIASSLAPRSHRAETSSPISRIVLDDLPLDVKGTKLSALGAELQERGEGTFRGLAAGDFPSGTLGYIDPECVARLSPANASSDLYSLAALIYECLTGSVPAAAAALVANKAGLLPSVVDGREAAPPLLDVAPEVPPRLARLVDRMLSPDPARRPKAAEEVCRELEEIQREELARASAGPPGPAAPEGPSGAGRGARGAAIAVGGVVGASLLVAGLFVVGWRLTHVQGAAPATTGHYESPSSWATSVLPAPKPTYESPPSLPLVEEPWGAAIAEGQRRLTDGDPDGAGRKFDEAISLGGGAVAQTFKAQLATFRGAAGPCKVVAYSHPRLGYDGAATRPSIAAVPGGAVVVWTDAHERTPHDHAYSVMLDPTGHPTSRARDLTPEGESVFRPTLLTVGERVALVYWDGRPGAYAGVRARWLGADGRIAGHSVQVDTGRPVNLWPVIARIPPLQGSDGGAEAGFVVAWQDDRANTHNDEVFVRRLGPDLEPVGDERQITSVGTLDGGAAVRTPSVAVRGGTGATVVLAYIVERGEKQRYLKLRRLPANDLRAPNGLSHGETIISFDRSNAPDSPQVACAGDGCFLVWHGLPNAAYVAAIDLARGGALWQKKLPGKASRPGIAASDRGLLAAYLEEGRVKVVPVSGDGVGTPTTIGRASKGDISRPSVAPGRSPNEWLVAWLDDEGGQPEIAAARLVCQMQ